MPSMPTEKEQFITALEREFQTTLKVLKAYPAERAAYKPSEKSKSAVELAWAFPSEEQVAIPGVLAGAIDWNAMKKAPETMKEAIAAYEKSHKEVVQKIKATPDADLNKTIKFFVAPKKTADLRRGDVLWMMLMDQIHHRGQFSVYLRLVGAKVPSIYGPTADEPWM